MTTKQISPVPEQLKQIEVLAERALEALDDHAPNAAANILREISAIADQVPVPSPSSDLRGALEDIIGTLDAHDAISYDCDRSGEIYCDCLDKAVKKARAALSGESGGENGNAVPSGALPREIFPNCVKREWVKCPICNEPGTRKEIYKDGRSLIFCVNHGCASNGDIKPASLAEALDAIHTFAHCTAKAGPLALKTWPEVWSAFDKVAAMATGAKMALRARTGQAGLSVEEFLVRENKALRDAGCMLSEAALRVCRESDGVHRLMLTVSNWATAVANEGGRGERHAPPAAETGVEKTYDDSASKHVKAMQQPLVDALRERFKPPSGPYPFNLARALAGAALVTRDGREAAKCAIARQPSEGIFGHYFTAYVDDLQFCYTKAGRMATGHDPLDLFMRDPEPSAPPVPEESCRACGGRGIVGWDNGDCPNCHGTGNAPVIQPKADVPFLPNQSSRDWTEDFSHENGNYGCLCVVCGQSFNGHKRRHICRECAHPPRDNASAPDADGECQDAFFKWQAHKERPILLVEAFEAGAKWAKGKDAEATSRLMESANIEIERLQRYAPKPDGVGQEASPPAEGGPP